VSGMQGGEVDRIGGGVLLMKPQTLLKRWPQPLQVMFVTSSPRSRENAMLAPFAPLHSSFKPVEGAEPHMFEIIPTLQFFRKGDEFFRWILRQGEPAHILWKPRPRLLTRCLRQENRHIPNREGAPNHANSGTRSG
jgi:hypothetical protein